MIPPAILTLIQSKWLRYGLLALVCAALWVRGEFWQGRAERHEAAYNQLVVDTQQASERASILALEAKQKTEDRYAELARQADAERRDFQELRARADRYARANRVLQDAGGSPGATSPTAGAGVAQSGDGPGTAAELVAIPRSDFDLIGVYVERLTRVRDWSQSLQAEGFAVVTETGE